MQVQVGLHGNSHSVGQVPYRPEIGAKAAALSGMSREGSHWRSWKAAGRRCLCPQGNFLGGRVTRQRLGEEEPGQ